MARLGDYIIEYSVKNKENHPYSVYSVTNSNGFCTEYFTKDVSGKNKRTYKIVPRGYFAYNPSRINVGSIDWQSHEDYVIVSPLYTVFKCSEELDKEYLKMFLKSDYGNQLINANTTGSVRANLKFEVLSEFKIKMCPLENQKKIVKEINDIKKSINLEKHQINLFDELVKARFVEMFGDPLCNDKKWQMVTINDVGKCVAGATPSTKKKEYWENGTIPWMSSGEVHKYRICNTDTKITEEGYKNASTKLVPPYTVVLAMAGQGKTRGTAGITEIELCTNQSICSIVNNERINPWYLLFFLKLQYKELRNASTCAEGRGGLNLKIIGDFPIMLPSIELQNQFEAFVKEIDKSKFVCQNKIKYYQELLEKKMNEYFGE